MVWTNLKLLTSVTNIFSMKDFWSIESSSTWMYIKRLMIIYPSVQDVVTWICLFDAWEKFQTYSPKSWFDGELPWYNP